MSTPDGNSAAKTEAPQGQVLTRIFIQADGNLLVTDLWEEIETLLKKEEGFSHVVDPSL